MSIDLFHYLNDYLWRRRRTDKDEKTVERREREREKLSQCLLSLFPSRRSFAHRHLHETMEPLQVKLRSPQEPVVWIKAKAGCDDKGNMDVYPCKCSEKTVARCPPRRFWGACQEEGAQFCLPTRLASEPCAVIIRNNGTHEDRSAELNLTNVIFYNSSKEIPNATSWVQDANTAELSLNQLVGVPNYKLKLKDTSKNKNLSCQELELIGNTEESPGRVIFRANWHQEIIPGCNYKVKFSPMGHCNQTFYISNNRLENLKYNVPNDEPIEVEPMNMRITAATVGISSLLVVVMAVILLLLLLKLKQARMRPRSLGMQEESTPLTPCQAAHSPQPNVLLVYPFHLQPQMTALATRLKELTSLQIEDLHDVGNQDKLNDPTVWLTRRLMKTNTYFVLAGVPTLRPDNKESSEERHEGAVHFLHGHFLQHLHSSNLAYDYKRLHVVRFDDEAQEVSDVTPGRVYQLPAHLSQLVHNLTIGMNTTTTI